MCLLFHIRYVEEESNVLKNGFLHFHRSRRTNVSTKKRWSCVYFFLSCKSAASSVTYLYFSRKISFDIISNVKMVYYGTSNLFDEGNQKFDRKHGRVVFRSLCVDRTSKTPYSDATQVS